MKDILFILDRAHGSDVKGKSSPDGTFKEWLYSKKTIDRLKSDLTKLGIPWDVTVVEDLEPGLTQRVIRANKLADTAKVAIMLSLHNNAGGGTGIELFTSPGEDESDKIAHIIGNRFIQDFKDIKYRLADNKQLDKESNFTVLVGTNRIKPKYKAVLTEFLFMDTEKDLALLKDDKIFEKYIDCLLYSIVEICKHYKFGNFLIP